MGIGVNAPERRQQAHGCHNTNGINGSNADIDAGLERRARERARGAAHRSRAPGTCQARERWAGGIRAAQVLRGGREGAGRTRTDGNGAASAGAPHFRAAEASLLMD